MDRSERMGIARCTTARPQRCHSSKSAACDQRIGLDLPLRALAWEDATGKVWLAMPAPENFRSRYELGTACDGPIEAMSAGIVRLMEKATEPYGRQCPHGRRQTAQMRVTAADAPPASAGLGRTRWGSTSPDIGGWSVHEDRASTEWNRYGRRSIGLVRDPV